MKTKIAARIVLLCVFPVLAAGCWPFGGGDASGPAGPSPGELKVRLDRKQKLGKACRELRAAIADKRLPEARAGAADLEEGCRDLGWWYKEMKDDQEFQGLLQDCADRAAALREALAGAEDQAKIQAAEEALKASCTACHEKRRPKEEPASGS